MLASRVAIASTARLAARTRRTAPVAARSSVVVYARDAQWLPGAGESAGRSACAGALRGQVFYYFCN